MKYANVTQNNLSYENRIIVESTGDLLEYFDSIEPEFRAGITALLKTKEPMGRWDHLIRSNNFGSVLAMAVTKTGMNGGNTLFELAKVYDKKLFTMMKYIIDGRVIMINNVGGYCFVSTDANVEYITKPSKKIDYFIAKNPNYINLENDPFLEDYTVNYFQRNNQSLSHVLNSFSLTKDELKEILTEFKSKGGIGVWQYTTAMDIDQLYMFIDTGIKVGLTEFIMNFNAGSNQDIVDLIDHYNKISNIKFESNFV